MRGLLKNNVYTVWANVKVFAIFMFILGIFVIVVCSQPFQINYAMIGIVGFSVNGTAGVKNEYVSKWGKYKLTLPVRRTDIIKSYFVNQIIWLLIGTLFIGTVMGLSWLLHGCPFDQPIDALTMFALGISVSLFMGAMFFPLFFLGGAERSDVFWVIALLCACGIDVVIITVINELLEPGITNILFGSFALITCSVLFFMLSYFLSAFIFRKKEY